MSYSKSELWRRFQKYYTEFPSIGLAVDLSRMNFAEDYFSQMAGRMQCAFDAMAELEKGAIANPDEKRMVGHYWLRNPALAPPPSGADSGRDAPATVLAPRPDMAKGEDIAGEIREALAAIKDFSAKVHSGEVRGSGGPFKNLLLIGIGGSALGPQFVASALRQPDCDKMARRGRGVSPRSDPGALRQPDHDKMALYSFDNTDPDGMDKVLAEIGPTLGQTLAVVVSKSGGTQETRNGMLEAEAAYAQAGLGFPAHAVAITMQGSKLDIAARDQHWLRRFPMWDWVGGRTSELSAVGLLPAALQGFDIDAMLAGAKACDEVTRIPDLKQNPAAQLALMWFYSGNGKGTKNMVILPYKDRLELFSKYLQQLIMESLGKRYASGKDGDILTQVVKQGITVFGNKGSTDQHSYIQQLRDGLENFFVTFIEVLRDRAGASMTVEPNVTSGDYLEAFMLGTRSALYDDNRESVTLTIKEVNAFNVGVLIALFERTVGLYASLININAYHQPGVQAGKKAAEAIVSLQARIIGFIESLSGPVGLQEIADKCKGDKEPDVETVFKVCEHLAANPDRRIRKMAGATPFDGQYELLR